MADDSIAYTYSDKGLVICAIELEVYIRDWCLKHLCDTSTYQIIPAEQAWTEAAELYRSISGWITKYNAAIGNDAAHYLWSKLVENSKEPFGFFYVMPKIHKPGPKGSKTRPVFSDCASLLHPIG